MQPFEFRRLRRRSARRGLLPLIVMLTIWLSGVLFQWGYHGVHFAFGIADSVIYLRRDAALPNSLETEWWLWGPGFYSFGLRPPNFGYCWQKTETINGDVYISIATSNDPVAQFTFELEIPIWILVSVATFIAIFMASRALRNTPLNMCQECGYDTRSNPSRCSECGAVPQKLRPPNRVDSG